MSYSKNIILGGGCFWCTEAVFKKINGVLSVFPGYIGGNTDNPTYREICTGLTGHAEVIKVDYDSRVVSLKDVLMIFFSTHDPTTLNRQGNDIGTQYRSSIFTSNLKEIKIINDYITELNQSNNYSSPVVTTIEMENIFYMAEDYHQNYFEMNQNAPYCSMVIKPKLNKFLKKNKSILKEN
jgi:peptide-methionine (S)-S-oxide reductase|tara:strand:+ start:490 stop:1032 length:543 start_codon:yes stop_codon:yes gene_type:complete